MNFDIFKEYEPLYIIGHKKPDVDSVISTIILSKIFKNNNIKCYPCFLNKGYEIDEYNTKILNDCVDLNMHIIDNDDDSLNYVLVDHNDPTQSIGFGKRVVWGIDHHKNSKILSNILLDNTCSCALNIYNFFKDKYKFSNEEKFLIAMASLADSLFFKGSRYSERDKKLFSELGYDLDSNRLFKKYFIPTDLSLGIEHLFNNITKTYNYKGVKFDSLVIKTYNEYEYLKQDFINEIKNKNNFLGVWIDFNKEMSYAYFKYNANFKEFIYDFLASRAATVIPDVFKYIDACLENNIKNNSEQYF